MSLRRSIRIITSIAIIILFLLHGMGGRLKNGFIESLERQTYDARINSTLLNTVDERIVIADIDEKSLSELGRWPWGRNILANLMDTLFDHYNIKVVGFDIVFAENDSSSGLDMLESLAQGQLAEDISFQETLAKIKPELQFDEQFSESLQGRAIVLGHVFNQSEAVSINPLPRPIYTLSESDRGKLPLIQPKGYTTNIGALQNSAPINGFFDNPVVDEDGIYRRVPVLQEHQGGLYESLALAVSRVALNKDKPTFNIVKDGDYIAIEHVNLGDDHQIPLDKNASILVNYRGRQNSFPYLSIADILSKQIPKEALADKIVLIGTSAPGLLDLRSTPVQKTYPGVEVHANIVSSILDNRVKYEPPYIRAIELILLAVIGIAMMVALSFLSPLWTTVFTFFFSLFIVIANMLAWHQNLVLPLASPLLLILGLFIWQMTYGFFVESRGKRELAKLFGQYIPPELVDEMAEDPTDLLMEAQTREMTVLFSDVRGFTTISEGLESKELSKLMNSFLTPMTHVIHDHRGTIDKYIGDAIMAFWGAPLDDPHHAKNALVAAMNMISTLGAIQPEFKARGWPEINIGIGLNTAPMSVGNMGSEFRMAYTVLGDAVNLGSRLEGLTKQYGVSIIVSENTANAVPEFDFLELDYVTVKGKDKPVKIYEPIGLSIENSKELRQEIRRFNKALALYREQKWELAENEIFSLQQSSNTKDRRVYAIYLERIAYFKSNPPAENWNGVFEHTSK